MCYRIATADGSCPRGAEREFKKNEISESPSIIQKREIAAAKTATSRN
jgi:ribosomal protein S21